MPDRKRYALVGTGGRCRMFIDAIHGDHAEHAQLVGLCDPSPTRMGFWNRHIEENLGAQPVPTYRPDDFEKMIDEQRVDEVIVTTVDAYHHEYIVRAMEAGCDVVSEKPMTIDEVKAREIFDAIDRTGKSLRVTFNYRYTPESSKMRELIMNGEIGEPLSVQLNWYLDTRHGADYFHRWHREKDKSGGLLVHKATHHFDLVNFLVDSFPQTVFSMGGLKFYGRQNAEARGEHYDYDRYTNVAAAKDDPFAVFLNEAKDQDNGLPGRLQQLYLDAEQDGGYIRDRNVFGDNITAEDTMAVTARYRNGVILSYSLIAYSPWEGERVVVTGTKGQVEYFSRGVGHLISGQSDEELAAEQYAGEKYVRLQKMFQPPREIEVPSVEGGHGGGDPLLLDRIFNPDPPADPLRRDATHIEGAASILLGIAANHSIATGQPVNVDDLLKLPARQEAATVPT